MRCPSDCAQAKLALGPAGTTAAGAGTAALRSDNLLQPTRTSSTKQAQTRITSPQTSSTDAPGAGYVTRRPGKDSFMALLSAHLALTHTHLRASKEAISAKTHAPGL